MSPFKPKPYVPKPYVPAPTTYFGRVKEGLATRHGSSVDSGKVREAIGYLQTWIREENPDEEDRSAKVVVVRNTLNAIVYGEHSANASKELSGLPSIRGFTYYRYPQEYAADPSNAPSHAGGRDSAERKKVAEAINELAQWMLEPGCDLNARMQVLGQTLDAVMNEESIVRIPAGMPPPQVSGVEYVGEDGREEEAIKALTLRAQGDPNARAEVVNTHRPYGTAEMFSHLTKFPLA